MIAASHVLHSPLARYRAYNDDGTGCSICHDDGPIWSKTHLDPGTGLDGVLLHQDNPMVAHGVMQALVSFYSAGRFTILTPEAVVAFRG